MRLYFWSAMIIIKQSIENAISPVMNPMINMTTHLLMLIFSRSCVKKKQQQQKGHSAVGEANKQNFFCRPGGGGGGTWVNYCWVCATGLLEPLPHCSLFCGHL